MATTVTGFSQIPYAVLLLHADPNLRSTPKYKSQSGKQSPDNKAQGKEKEKAKYG